MTDLESTILSLLRGRDISPLAVTRDDLVSVTGCPGRANRDAIASLQAQGFPIVSLGKGYWLGTQEEVEAYKRREWKRLRTLAEKLKGFMPQVNEALKQLDLGF
jgi:hypothetical protein